jgi:hypothetical protein
MRRARGSAVLARLPDAAGPNAWLDADPLGSSAGLVRAVLRAEGLR